MEQVKNIKKSFKESKIYKIYQNLLNRKWFPYVFFLYVIAFIMFFATLVNNEFTIPVSGDFTLQEIPFYYNGYDDWWHFFKTGEFVLWDDSAMLGVNNIGANSFYYLFNPFFLVLLICPRSLLAQGQAFMMITKMVLAGVTMKMLLDYFKVKKETSWLVGIAYAFCGYNFYYLWFNHFLEIAVLMPLVLLGVEKIIKEQKPMMLVLTIFVCGLTNYYFLISFCFCGVIYGIFRYFQNLGEYNRRMKENKITHNMTFDVRGTVIFQGIFAFACGLMLTAIILLPCFATALDNPRTSSASYLPNLTNALKALFSSIGGHGELSFKEAFTNLTNYLFKWEYAGGSSRNYIYPLVAFFTPNVSCMDSVVFNTYTYSYASMFIYTPLMLLFIPSLIQSFKTRHFSTVVGALGMCLMLFTPFVYYCFSGFTDSAYGRWYIFVTAVACVFIATQFDKREKMSIWYLDLSFGVIAIFYGFMLYKGELLKASDMDESIYYFYGEMVYIVILYFYMRKNFRKSDLVSDLRYFIAFEAIVMCNITLIGQGTTSYQGLYGGKANYKEEIRLVENIKNEDKDYFRVFSTSADRSANNLGMVLSSPGMGTFHSTFNYELNKFLNWSTVKYSVSESSWSMGIHEKRINLDEFVGTKYYILKDDDYNIPFGFSEYISTDDHVVYINDNFIELGYAFDTIINENVMKDFSYYQEKSDYILTNEKAYLTGAILNEDDLEEIFGSDYESMTRFNYISNEDASSISQGIITPSLNNNLIKIFYKNGDNFENRGSYTSSAARGLTYGSYVDIDTSSLNIGSDCQTRGKCFVTVQARMGENLNIVLYGRDEDDKEYVLTSDKHMTHWFNGSKGSESKRQRGFYVDDKVTRVRIEILDNMNSYNSTLLKPYLSYEYEDTYLQQIELLKKNSLKNICVDVNDFSFDTDFDKEKMIVLQIPYDQGWKVKVFDENNNQIEGIKIYKAQGGFLSILAPQGNYHYEFEYETPYLLLGIKVMYVGLLCAAVYIILEANHRINMKRIRSKYINNFGGSKIDFETDFDKRYLNNHITRNDENDKIN